MVFKRRRVRSNVLVLAAGLPAASSSTALAQSDPLREPFPAVLELSQLDGRIGFRMDGTNLGDTFRKSVGGAGDFNGDGIDDLVVGAPRHAFGGVSESGAAFVVFGSNSGFPAVLSMSDLDGRNGLFVGGTLARFVGDSVAYAGDINGDGVGDVVIGAPNTFDGDTPRVGAAYVVLGRADGHFDATFSLSDLDGRNGFSVFGDAAWDSLGASVATAGDVNGDGVDDVVLGAPFAGGDPGYVGYGEGYVVFGRDASAGAEFPARLDSPDLEPPTGFRIIEGGHRYGKLGDWVSTAGDVNGDGFDDMVLSSRGHQTHYPYYGIGPSYVIFGSPDASHVEISLLDGTNGFEVFSGASRYHSGGIRVGSAGDINADGITDIVLSGHQRDAFVVFGRVDGFPASINLDDIGPSEGFAVYYTSWQAPFAVGSPGDVNGDGIDDMVFGVPAADPTSHPSLASAGSVFVLYESPDGYTESIDLGDLDGSDGFRINGVERHFNMGFSVAAAGDINGDGVSDLIIGRYRKHASSDHVGNAYVVFGRTEPCAPDLDGDGMLTIFDFLQFGNLFDLMDPRADFDADGEFTVFDFLAFQNAFDAGCP